MTRINLLRNLAAGSAHTESVPIEMGFGGESSSGGSSSVLIKLLAAMMIPGLVIYYEKDNLANLKTKSVQLTQELDAVEAEITNNASVAEGLKQFTSEKARLEQRIATIRELNRPRLHHVRMFDFLQSIVPLKAWLSTVSVKEGNIVIQGSAMNADDITKLIKEMEKSVFFTEVLLMSSTEESTTKGSYKKFEIHCKLGKSDG